MASGSVGVYGVVLDPVYQARHSELRDLMAERNFDAILDPRTQEPRPTGIYVAPLGVHLTKDEATAFSAAHSAKSRFGCRAKDCCPKSWKDMLDNPVRHSLVRRSLEVQWLSDVPGQHRAQCFLEETVRPATDAAVFSESLSFDGQERLAKRMSQNRKSLERLRVGLGRFVEESGAMSFSPIPRRRAVRD